MHGQLGMGMVESSIAATKESMVLRVESGLGVRALRLRLERVCLMRTSCKSMLS